jgi:EmrB/QacA subfamily drug resistance transporter
VLSEVTVHEPAASHHHDDDDTAVPRRSWWLLVLLCAAQFMVVLDITVVNVALPSIGASLDVAPSDLAWVVTAYALAGGGLLLLGGRAADLLGRRPVFLAGLALFTVASLASGLATSPDMLIAARAAQGVGAALLTPGALSIIVTTYTGPQHHTALAAWGAIGSAGAAAGMLFGGMLTSWLSWEWVFLVNVPIGAAVFALGWRAIPRARMASRVRRGLDLPGAATVVAGLVVLVYALEGAPDHGWGSARTLGLLAGAAALLGAFLLIERAVAHPLLAPSTWRMRSLVHGSGAMFVVTGILVGAFFLNSLYLQRVLGASALETGLAFLPIAVAIAAAAHLAAHLLPRVGSRVLAAGGIGLVALATGLMAAAPDHAGYAADLLPAFLVLGFGAGLSFPAVSVTAMSDVDHERAGVASGFMTTAHEVGAALGVAVLAAIAATGAGDAGTLIAGYGDAFVVAAIAAGAVALAALATFPVVRPAAGARVAMH